MLRFPFLFSDGNNDQLAAVRTALESADGPFTISNDSNVYSRFHIILSDLTVTVHRVQEGEPDVSGIPDILRIEIQAEESWFRQSKTTPETKATAETILRIIEAVYLGCESRPRFGYALTTYGTDIIPLMDRCPVDQKSLAKNAINYTTWITVFSPTLVETYGRETLLDAPVWRAEEWDDGAIALVTSPNLQYPKPLRPIDDHLGLANSMDDHV